MNAESETPVSSAIIEIFDCDVERDDLLATGTSENNGSFKIEWVAKKVDQWDNTAEVYAKFGGDDIHRHSASNHYTIVLRNKKPTK
jgi:hypothetical protein